MKFSYNFLQDYVDKKLPEPQKLAELLTMHSFEVEGVAKKGSDYILDIDILPNRAHDATGHIGIARDVAALIGARLKVKKYASPKRQKAKTGELQVKVENKTLTPRYMAQVVGGVKVKTSPAWLRERLKVLGLNSINNVVDAANYAMLATGQPLHAFDYDKLAQHKIVVRAAKSGETIQTLDDQIFILENSMLVIADGQEVLAIAGIKGGKKAEIDKGTKTIVIESAHFDPTSIRRTSRALGLHTDASWRFEHDTPIVSAEQGLSYVTELICELTGGKARKEVVDTLVRAVPKRVIALRPQYARSLLGTDITEGKMSSILKSLEFSVTPSKNALKVGVPEFRLDIEREEDLIEEVGRMVGYEVIEPSLPMAVVIPPRRNPSRYWGTQIRHNLASRGFNELYNLSFVSKNVISVWGFAKRNLWKLAKPLSEDLTYMRPSLVPDTLRVVKENLRFFDEVRTFEIGEVFYKSAKASEETRLCISITAKQSSDAYFYELKEVVVNMFNSLGISDIWFDDALSSAEQKKVSFLHPSRRAQIKVGGSMLGFIGQINKDVAASGGLKGLMFVAELSFAALTDEAEREQIYAPVSPYPQSVRDISIGAGSDVRIGDVMRLINEAGGELLRDVDMFDYYEDASSAENLKSVAFHLIFQAEDRTLNSKEIDTIMNNITKAINGMGWEVR